MGSEGRGDTERVDEIEIGAEKGSTPQELHLVSRTEEELLVSLMSSVWQEASTLLAEFREGEEKEEEQRKVEEAGSVAVGKATEEERWA